MLPIVIYGEPVLHRIAEPVTEFNDELAELVSDMYETTVAAPGVGLAAPQVGIGKQIFVWVYDQQSEAAPRGVAINPHLWIEPIEPGAPTEADSEGCLSFPGYQFPIKRSSRALLRAQDETGEHYEITASGWFARILQHEYDHLRGTIYIDRLGREAEMSTIMAERGWGKPGQSWTPIA